MSMTPEQLSLRARMGAHAMHAKGKTNTATARKVFRDSFLDKVDPDGMLDPAERAKRADHAYKAHMLGLALKSATARRKTSSSSSSTTTRRPDRADDSPIL